VQTDQNTAFVCPSCGAPVDAARRFDEAYTCPFCGNTATFGGQVAAAEQAAPASARLANLHSRFELGQEGQIRGKLPFKVIGLLQVEYASGYWTEWRLDVAGQEYWLQEDEGVYVLFARRAIEEPLPPPERLRPGENLDGWNQMPRTFIIEVGRARVVGWDGDLPFTPDPDEWFTYVDGLGGGKVVSLEIEADGRSAGLATGDPLEYEDLHVAGEPGGDW
jgi:hypothetical protein